MASEQTKRAQGLPPYPPLARDHARTEIVPGAKSTPDDLDLSDAIDGVDLVAAALQAVCDLPESDLADFSRSLVSPSMQVADSDFVHAMRARSIVMRIEHLIVGNGLTEAGRTFMVAEAATLAAELIRSREQAEPETLPAGEANEAAPVVDVESSRTG